MIHVGGEPDDINGRGGSRKINSSSRRYSQWIVTVSHRPNSEPNLPQFNERAGTVAGLQQVRFRMWLKGRCGNNCHMAAVTVIGRM